MSFLHAGLAVAGLVAVAIPLVIHLLWRPRQAPRPWAAMRFLLAAYRRKRTRLRLERWLLLAMRCVIPLLLGLALARPLVEAGGHLRPRGARTVYLVIDNGVASTARGAGGRSALARHRDLALRIAEELGAGDRLDVITAAAPAARPGGDGEGDVRAAMQLLSGMEASKTATDLPGALSVLEERLWGDVAGGGVAIVLSEFRAGSADLGAMLPAVGEEAADGVELMAAAPALSPLSNVQVMSIEPARRFALPGDVLQSGHVTVALRRCGGRLEAASTTVAVTGGGASSEQVVTWTAGQVDAVVHLQVEAEGEEDGGVRVRAAIDEDAVTADNERFQTIELRRRAMIALLGRASFGIGPVVHELTAGQWIARALDPAGTQPFDFAEVDPAALDASDLRGVDVAVVTRPDLAGIEGWRALRGFVEGGGLLVVMPPVEEADHSWTSRMPQELGLPWSIGSEAVKYGDGRGFAADQPRGGLLSMLSGELAELLGSVEVRQAMPVRAAGEEGSWSLVLDDGSPLLVWERVGGNAESGGRSGGLVVYLAVPPHPAWTDLPGRPVMVPLFQELIRAGLDRIHGTPGLVVGDAAATEGYRGVWTWLTPRGRRVVASSAPGVEGRVMESGFLSGLDAAGRERTAIAVNVDPEAARTDAQRAEAVQAWLSQSGSWRVVEPEGLVEAVRRPPPAASLAGPLLVAVLLVVAGETVLGGVFSRGGVVESGSIGAEGGGR